MMHILLVLLSYMLRLICSQPGDPDNKGLELEEQQNPEEVLLYEDHSLEVQYPSIVF
jgi:hypothetical protein